MPDETWFTTADVEAARQRLADNRYGGPADMHDLAREDIHEIIQIVLTATWRSARRQATEGWEREWGVRYPDGYVYDDVTEAAAREIVARWPHRVVLARLVGPWETAEQPEPTPAAEATPSMHWQCARCGLDLDGNPPFCWGCSYTVYRPIHHEPASGGVVDPAPAEPCPEGFHWIGQSFATCDKCGLPAWDHAGHAEPAKGSGPFGGGWELRPWKPGEREACKAKWGPRDPAPAQEAEPDVCPKSRRVDGPYHSTRWDGDDARTVCVYCGQVRDALTGAVIRPGALMEEPDLGPLPERRLRGCVEQWPECYTGGYDPRCCRFPKSCSATVYGPETTEDLLEESK